MDQVRLWEEETVRVRYTECNMYESFESPELYSGALEHARTLGALLWWDDARRVFAARTSGHEQLRDFIKRLKESMARADMLLH